MVIATIPITTEQNKIVFLTFFVPAKFLARNRIISSLLFGMFL